MASAGPHHPLNEVKALVANGSFWVSRRDLDELVLVCGTHVKARAYVTYVMLNLTDANFCQTIPLTWDTADEYGIVVNGCPWYIKVCIDQNDPEASIISFHPPKRPMRTRAGTIKPP